jgi:hypothetical protein
MVYERMPKASAPKFPKRSDLSAYEREILDAFEKGEMRSTASKAELERYRAAARATLQELRAQKGSLAMPKQQLTRNPAKR